MTDLCPNLFPLLPPTISRLAVVGEAPGEDEMVVHEPFVGTSGRFLRAMLSNAGLSTNQIFFGNVCQHHPPQNDIEKFSFDGEEIQSGIATLTSNLAKFHPHCILLLGKTAFRAARPDLCYPTKNGYVVPLSDWRGSLFTVEKFGGAKSLSTFHPAFILRSYADIAYFKLDLARAAKHARFPELNLLPRRGTLRPCLCEVLDFLRRIELEETPISFDIEGFADDVGVTMLSICDSPTTGIVIPFWIDGTNYWSEDEEVQVWQALSQMLANPLVRKTAHSGFYELFVLAWRHCCVVNNLHDDTMFLHWENFVEAGGDPDKTDTGKKRTTGLGRDLGSVCSIWTEQPYYKDQRLSKNTETKLNYNFLDSAVTHEICTEANKALTKYPFSLEHYRFNINLIPAYNYIMLRGCKFDINRLAEIRETVEGQVNSYNKQIREATGRDFNSKSGDDKAWLLFDRLGYTPLKRKFTKTGKPQTDESVLLHFWAKDHNPIIRLVIQCVRQRTRLQDINKLVLNEDGRIRTSFDPVGTNTGRLSSRASTALRFIDGEWSKTGTNLQNVTKDLRVCFIPDSEQFDFWQCDLSGADGWTVGADLAALGYPAMLDDYLAGIKPALVLNLMWNEYEAGRPAAAVNQMDRNEIKRRIREIKVDYDSHDGQKLPDGRDYDWRYLCCKRGQHGTNYGAQPDKIAEVIFTDSDGTIDISKKDAGLLQYFYKLRYKTDVRNDWIRSQLSRTGTLVSSCGIRRQFFSIRNRSFIDDAIVREAASFDPQANTTWSTNKALEKMWYDPTNRTSRGTLFIEPLLQIHDALAGQSRQAVRDFAREKFAEYFNNPLTIHGIRLTIPADCKYGPNWKETYTSLNI